MSDDITGAVIDRPIKRSRWTGPMLISAGVALIVALIGYALISAPGDSLRVDADRLTISTAVNGVFENYTTIHMRAVPERTLRVTSISAGRISQVHARNGDVVKEGQVLFEISSFELQRSIQEQESTILEAQSNLQKQRIDLDDQVLQRESALATRRFELTKLDQELQRKRLLAETGDISASELADYEAQYEMQSNQLSIEEQLHASFIESADIQRAQFGRMVASQERDLENLDRLRDSVNIRAPSDGVLAEFALDVGDSVQRDADIASVHSKDSMKMRALVSEEHIEELYEGFTAIADFEGTTLSMTVSRIDPDIVEGAFTVELSFGDNGSPAGLRRGRTLSGRLLLSEPRDALMITSGPYVAETGGDWLYVVDPSSGVATRRPVVFGDTNVRVTEVLEGLQAGEKVITLSYRDYLGVSQLRINAGD